ncbi:MAG TPA: cytochrome c biogenesis protein CcsA, partial [Gemmatales bacterium]|nr:cytochrome c biogenesis protein CcsA [Gemmatales bacterium]
KRISPMDLHNSIGFQRLLVEVNRQRELDAERYQQKLDPMERKADAVNERLRTYELLTGSLDTRDKPASARENQLQMRDPIHYIAFDKIPDSAWFSIGELRFISTAMIAPALSREENANFIWGKLILERAALQPRLYLNEAARQSLAEFQAALKAGQGDAILTSLEDQAKKTAVDRLAAAKAARKATVQDIDKLSDAEFSTLLQRFGVKNISREEMKKQLIEQVSETDVKQITEMKKAVEDLRTSIKIVRKPFIANDPRYNQLYMAYLEARHRDVYHDAAKAQPFPMAQARTILAAYDAVGAAYRQEDPAKFAEKTAAFQQQVTEISKSFTQDKYPGENTTKLELTLNRVEPFKWAWISMLMAAILFGLSMKLENKTLYAVAFVPMIVSLGFQLFAYYGRVTITGRPPVSNMFETVIFVASMGAVFSLLLEYFYRSTVIILAGACIATLGMIMADQLPYDNGFDAKMGPLQPVLRSNYWLIIHVMTIVASYAAGALAWAIGNISLILYWFNSDRRDLLKALSNLCYSAIKVAVLLLGVGTLLGGIWAAESWGRFWGWDPKETWALIALLIYLIPLHARYIGWVKDFGLAVSSVVCFSAIVMSWYGVNFVLAAGLHSYGMGDGGPWTIFLLGSINLFWVLLVCNKRASQELATA